MAQLLRITNVSQSQRHCNARHFEDGRTAPANTKRRKTETSLYTSFLFQFTQTSAWLSPDGKEKPGSTVWELCIIQWAVKRGGVNHTVYAPRLLSCSRPTLAFTTLSFPAWRACPLLLGVGPVTSTRVSLSWLGSKRLSNGHHRSGISRDEPSLRVREEQMSLAAL